MITLAAPSTETASVCVPDSGPSVHLAAASPSSSLDTSPGSMLPWPAPGSNRTATPDTGTPPLSRTRTPTGSVSDSPRPARCPSPNGSNSAAT